MIIAQDADNYHVGNLNVGPGLGEIYKFAINDSDEHPHLKPPEVCTKVFEVITARVYTRCSIINDCIELPNVLVFDSVEDFNKVYESLTKGVIPSTRPYEQP